MIERADSRPDRWARIWGALASDGLLLIWLGLLALAATAALIIPQAPRSAYQQVGGVEDWLTSVRPALGRPADTLVALGLLTVTHSTWLRLIVGGAAITLALRMFDALQHLRGRFAAFVPRVSHRVTIPLGSTNAMDETSGLLDRTMTQRIEEVPQKHLLAQRPLGYLGSLLLSAAGLVAIAGWAWTQIGGWELSELRLTEDIAAAVQPTSRVLELESLEVQWGDVETPATAVGRLSFGDGDDSEDITVGLHKSQSRGGVTFDFSAVGPAVRISGERSDGSALKLQTAASQPPTEHLTLPLPPDGGSRSLAAPEEGVVVQLESEWAAGPPRIRVRIYQGREGELVEDLVVSDQASIDVNDAFFMLDVIPFAEFTVSRSPGAVLVIVGPVLALLGLVIMILYPAHQLHVVAADLGEQTTLVLGVSSRRSSRWLKSLVDRLEADHSETSGDE